MEQFHVTPVESAKEKHSKKPIIILAAVALIALLAAGYLGYQYALSNTKVTQLNADKSKLASDISKLKADTAANNANALTDDAQPKNVNDLNRAYDRIVEQKVDLTSVDESTIMEVAKKHYKVDMLPEGAALLVGYQMVKPDTQPSGEIRALVYWPKVGDNPAEFIDIVRDAGSDAWHYQDSL